MGRSSFPLPTPRDFVLKRDLCSYGYFLLAPNRWHPREGVFERPFAVDRRVIMARVTQARRGAALEVSLDRAVSKSGQARIAAGLSRMLRLDEDAAHVRAFHALDPRWKASGRARLFRSPSFFEDVIKTVTSCNVTWASTIQMNRRLCEVVGGGAFPSADQLARTRVQTLRARCRVGYRDARIVELSRMVARGEVDPGWFEDPGRSDEEVRAALMELPGIGPYAANNILQLLGRYAHIPLDTESVRHGRAVLGLTGSAASVMKKVRAHFAPFGSQMFRSYWFEMWAHYEKKAGPSWTWETERTAKTFTASGMK